MMIAGTGVTVIGMIAVLIIVLLREYREIAEVRCWIEAHRKMAFVTDPDQ